MAKKLYEAKVELTVYFVADEEALAADGDPKVLLEVEAEEAIADAARDEGLHGVEVREVTHKDWPLAADWYSESLVYGTDTDTTIDSLLKTLPEDPAYARLLKLHHSLEPGRVKPDGPIPEEP